MPIVDRDPPPGLIGIFEELYRMMSPRAAVWLVRVVFIIIWVTIVVVAWSWNEKVGAFLAANSIGGALVYAWRRGHAV